MTSPHTNNKSRIVKITTAALLPIAAFASQPALAVENVDTKQIKVNYQDLNLASAKGQKRLSYRIKAAVEKACDIRSTRSIVERQNMTACKTKAIKSAYRQVASLMDSKKVKLANSSIFIVGN